jgi:hypothetical protein
VAAAKPWPVAAKMAGRPYDRHTLINGLPPTTFGKHDPEERQNWYAQAPPQRRRVRSVEQFDVVDVVIVIAADILLSHETGGAQRRDVIRVDGREQLADQRQRSDVPAPRLAAAGGITPHDQGLHDEVRDKLEQIGVWLGFDADTEIKVAEGAVVDAVWEVTIGNLGRVIYVFEVQTKGSIDSLIINLLKSLNNPAVQGIVAVSDLKQIERIKKEVSGVGPLREKLKYWDYKEVLQVHEALESVNEAINLLGLVPQSILSV